MWAFLLSIGFNIIELKNNRAKLRSMLINVSYIISNSTGRGFYEK